MLSHARRATLPFALISLATFATPSMLAQRTVPFVSFVFNSNPPPAPLRNNYTGFVGMKFTVGATPLYVTQLGRNFFPSVPATFSQTHLLKLVNAQTGVDVPNGSVTTTADGDVGSNGFLYANLPSTVLLQANTSYLLVSQETAGGDSWYDYTPVSPTSDAVLNAAVYSDAAGNYIPVANSSNESYVPVNFQYSLTAPPPGVTITSPVGGSTFTGSTVTFSATATPSPGLTIAGVQFQLGDSSGHLSNFGPVLTQAPYTLTDDTSTLTAGVHTLSVTATDSLGGVSTQSETFYIASQGGTLITGFSGTVVRNNYSGFVGLAFTVGSSPITAISLGRIGLPGNSGVHTLKLVNAQTGIDLQGGSTSITMTSGDGSTFQYASISPITLSANTSYLLLSQETNGGDTWYDYSPVFGTTGGTSIQAAVYSDSAGKYVLAPNTANYSYVPVNLAISVAGGGTTAGAVTITSPTNNSVFTSGLITFSANATPATGLTIKSVQFVTNSGDGSSNYGPALTTPPYTLAADSGLLGASSITLTAVATDSGGNIMTSAPVTFEVVNDIIPLIARTDALAGTNGISYPSGSRSFGMQFTVGATPLKVVGVGFSGCCSFQLLNETVKLIDAATGLDIPGGSTLVTAPGTPGFGYSQLASPITLQANKAYYVVGQTYGGGYLLQPAVTPGAGIINYPVYQTASNTYATVPSLPGYSYAAVTFEYESATALPPTVSITSPAPSSTVSGMVPVTFSAVSPQPLSSPSIQLQVDGVNSGSPQTPSPLAQISGVVLDTTSLSNGVHVLTAVATDSQGTQGNSSAVSVTVNNTSHSASNSPAFVTSFTPTFLRNNYSGFVGFSFTVGSAPVSISSLGRICVAGNSATHTVKLVQASNGSDLPGGSVSLPLSGCTAGQFVYTALTSPVTLATASSYYLVDQETAGGDKWYDYGSIAVSSAAATVNGSVYSTGSQFVTVASPGTSYVPLNFLFSSSSSVANPGFAVTLTISGNSSATAAVASTLPVADVQFFLDGYSFGAPQTSAPYTLPTVPAFNAGSHAVTAVAHDSVGNTVTSAPAYITQGSLTDVITFTGTTLRKNYSGWVGFRLTTGGSTSPVTSVAFPSTFSLGRLCSPGNSMVHLVKLVNASTGIDVPNAVAWINTAGCAAGTVLDGTLTGVTLAANTSYYLVSQEVNGGDSWYDISPAVPLPSTAAPVSPIQAEIGLYATSTGANFTIDGPVYTAADGSYVFFSSPNYSYVGLSIGGVSLIECNFGNVCGP